MLSLRRQTDGGSDRIDIVRRFTIFFNRKAKPHKHLKKKTQAIFAPQNYQMYGLNHIETKMYSYLNTITVGSAVRIDRQW